MNLSVKEKEQWNAMADSWQRDYMKTVMLDFKNLDEAITGLGLRGYAIGRMKAVGELDIKALAALAIAGGFGLRLPAKETTNA